MKELLTAEKARSARLKPTQAFDNSELSKVLTKIEQDCYLKTGIYWGYTLEEGTITKLRELGYTILELGTVDRPAYSIEWGKAE